MRHNGQITFPLDTRNAPGIKAGGTLLVERRGREIVPIYADNVVDPTAGVFKYHAYTRNPDVNEGKAWIARHIAETADAGKGD